MESFNQLNIFFRYIQAILGIVGILGNIVAFCIFSRPKLCRSSYSFYFRVVVVLDSILLAHPIVKWINMIFYSQVESIHSFFCNTKDYIAYVAGLASLWVMTLVLLDRLVTIVYFGQLLVIKKRFFQITSIIFILIICHLMYILMPIKKQPTTTFQDDSYDETFKQTENNTISCYNDFEINVVIAFVNIFSNTLINMIIYIKLIVYIYSIRKKVSSRRYVFSLRDLKFAISSIVITICCLISRLPLAIVLVMAKYFETSSEMLHIILLACSTVAILSNCATFLVNLFSNSIFYNEFLAMFGSRKQLNFAD